MRSLLRVLPLVCFVLAACQRDNNAVASASQSAAPAAAPQKSSDVTKATRALLPSFNDQRGQLGVSNASVLVQVRFTGLTTHVMQGVRSRAVLVDDGDPSSAGHTPTLLLPPSVDEAEVEAAFPDPKAVKCDPTGCEVVLDRVSMQLVHADGTVTTPTAVGAAHQTVAALLPKLGGLIPNLKPVVTGGKPADPVAAVFLYNGGDLTADWFGCRARFDNDPPNDFRFFASSVTLTQGFEKEVALRVTRDDPETSSATWHVIKLPGSYVPIVLANNAPGGSHFELFKKLHPNPPKPWPQVVKEPTCIHFLGEVPGCGNTQWP